MATKVRTVNDQIADAVKGQAAAKAEKAAAAKAAKAAKTAPEPKAAAKPAAKPTTRKPGNLKTTGLPNKIRNLRMKRSLSPKALADMAGGEWTASHVRRIERGARIPTEAQAEALAQALEVDVAALGVKKYATAQAAKPAGAKRTSRSKVLQAPALEPGESVVVDMENGEAVSA